MPELSRKSSCKYTYKRIPNQLNTKKMTASQLRAILTKEKNIEVAIEKILALHKKSDFDLSFIENDRSRELVQSFIDYRKEIKKPYKSQKSIEAFYKQLKQYSEGRYEYAEKVIQRSIGNGWQGIFALPEEMKVSNKVKIVT